MTERKLLPVEVASILELAARREGSTHLPGATDLTVSELMAVAEEVGLDPAEVRRASALVRVPAGGALAGVLGGPSQRTVRASTTATLPVERSRLREAVEASLGRAGEVVIDEAERWEWREDHGIGRTRVVVDHAEGSGVTVTADRAGHYLIAWLAAFLGWATAVATLPLPLGVGGIVTGFLAIPVGLVWPFWRSRDRALTRQLEDTALATLRATEGAWARE